MKTLNFNLFRGFTKHSIRKNYFFAILLLMASTTQAKTYYVSATGNDNNNGLSPATSWQTIIKINSVKFYKNDIVLFSRGDTFYGGIIVGRENLNFGAYGSGPKPIITGLLKVTGWVNLGGNIWEAPVFNVKNGVNLVLRDGIIQQIGRYPNADVANGGYLTYTASSTNSITVPELTSSINWTGAEVAIRHNRWEITKQKIKRHSGNLVTFTPEQEAPRLNYGCFFQRDAKTLDSDGEWWHNEKENKLRMYFSSNNPYDYKIEITTVDILFKSLYGSLSVSDLSFLGSGKKSIFVNGGEDVSIKNCDVINSGAEAITIASTNNVTVDNCTTTNSLGSGIRVINLTEKTVNLEVKNCTVINTAYLAGMEISNEHNGGAGITCYGGNGVTVQNNIVKNCGYVGIAWQGNNAYVKYNFVNTFCTLRDDGGGIYTVEKGGSDLPIRFNRNIIGNIVLNGIGNNNGSSDSKGTSARGLYFDLGTRTVLVDSNTVAYTVGGAVHGNNNANLTITNNIFFNNGKTYSLQRFADASPVRNIVIKKNILYPYRFEYRNLGINTPNISKEADLQLMGTIDSNYYSLKNGIDTSLLTITTKADNSNYQAGNYPFTYINGTVGIEKKSINVINTGTLEYNASNTPRVVNFSGFSKKDVFGNIYNNSATLPAWQSKVLIANGSVTSTNKAPIANAGNTQTIILPLNTVTLLGKGTDTDGSIEKYSWTKIAGPRTGTIVTPQNSKTVLLNLSSGVYQYELMVTDNNGATGKDTVQINVNFTLLPAVYPENTVNGLDYKYYEGDWQVLPSFSTLTIVETGTALNFDISSAKISKRYGFSFTGFINVPKDGLYKFFTSSDDGSELNIDNVLTVSNDGLHSKTEKSGVIGLKAGKHAITGLYFQRDGSDVFIVSYESDNISKQVIPTTSLYRINKLTAGRLVNGSVTALSGLSTENNSKEKNTLMLSCSPNPSHTEFGIFIQGSSDEKIEITALNTLGTIVYKASGIANKLYKFGNNFAQGIYIIKVIQGKNTQQIKVVKN